MILEKKENSKTGTANRAAIASEEASSIPFPPGRRKLHIRSLLLPFQIVTVSLGHNLAIWNFTTPHAIWMMAGRQYFANTFSARADVSPCRRVKNALNPKGSGRSMTVVPPEVPANAGTRASVTGGPGAAYWFPFGAQLKGDVQDPAPELAPSAPSLCRRMTC